jgi:hypothetical protein
MIGVEELRKLWLSHGYGQREFEHACKIYNPNDSRNYTCLTCMWWPLFENLYRDSMPFRKSIIPEFIDSE